MTSVSLYPAEIVEDCARRFATYSFAWSLLGGAALYSLFRLLSSVALGVTSRGLADGVASQGKTSLVSVLVVTFLALFVQGGGLLPLRKKLNLLAVGVARWMLLLVSQVLSTSLGILSAVLLWERTFIDPVSWATNTPFSTTITWLILGLTSYVGLLTTRLSERGVVVETPLAKMFLVVLLLFTSLWILSYLRYL